MTTYDGAWFAERLDIARGDAPRDFHAGCPVCGSVDNLHVTDKPGGAEAFCFGCQAKTPNVVEAIEDRPPAIKIRRVKGASRRRRVTPPADAKADPLGWYAAYCGVARDFLDGLPLSATPDGWVSHDFPAVGVSKHRQAGTDARRWSPEGAHTPAIWPLDDAMPREVLLTEGESDAIALRGVGYGMAYSAGSASGVPSVADFRSMARRGVESVFVGYDADEPGQKGAEKAMENAMAAGLSAARIVPPDYDSLTGTGKDWREFVLAGNEELPESNLGRVVKTVERIKAETPSTVPWVAYPVAYSGGLTVLAGPPKGGKSTILGHLARCAETGERFLGEFDVRRGTPVLTMTEEYGVPVVMKTEAFGLTSMEVIQRSDAIRAGWGLADALAASARWVSSHDGGIVVVDTLAVWAGIENENDASETTIAVENIRHALADRGAAVVLVHHTRKGGGIAGEATRGSGAIAAACDVQAELTYHDAADPTDSRRWLTVRGRILDTTRILVEYDTAAHAYSVVDEADEANAELREWLDVVPRESEDPNGMSLSDLEGAWGIKAGAKRAKYLVGKGLLRKSDDLVKVGRGKEWRYWRADVTVNRRTVEPRLNRDGSAVDGEAGATAPEGRFPRTSDHRTTERGYIGSSVRRSESDDELTHESEAE